jgi:hypothetical protein
VSSWFILSRDNSPRQSDSAPTEAGLRGFQLVYPEDPVFCVRELLKLPKEEFRLQPLAFRLFLTHRYEPVASDRRQEGSEISEGELDPATVFEI